MVIRKTLLALAFVLIAIVIGLLGTFPLPRDAVAADDAKKPTPSTEDAGDRKADRAEIQKQMEGFVKAFEGGDAERVASYWTANGEMVEGDGRVYRGRAAIAKAYRGLFGDKAKRRAEVEMDVLRFPSQDTAIEEGHFKVRVGKEDPNVSRYSVLHVREDKTWRMAVVREWPADPASLRDLGWLIGTWVAKSDEVEVHTTYKWLWDKSFIRADFTIREKDHTLSGFQLIGADPASGQLRSWTFESEGGFGDASWTREGKKWVLEATGRLPDGGTMTATNIFIPLGPDSFTWQTTQRTVNDEEVEDLPPVKVTRVASNK